MKTSRSSRRWLSLLALISACALSAYAAAPARPTLALMNADGTEVLDVDQPQVLGWGLPFANSLGIVSSSLEGVNSPRHVREVVAIASGNSHTLALQKNGRVVAWGWSTRGQCDVPLGLTNVVAIAAGGEHSMALRRDGTVVMWGEATSTWTVVPEGLTDVIAIATGAEHALALKRDGTVVSWGRNRNGEVTVPEGLSGVTMIAAGSTHSIALKSDGTVVAWGAGGNTAAASLSKVTSIAAGGPYSGAIMQDGSAVTWSVTIRRLLPAGKAVKSLSFDIANGYAFIKDGAVTQIWSQTPALPADVKDASNPTVALATSTLQGTALHRDGTLTHWNISSFGLASLRQPPVDLTQTVSIAPSYDTLLALRADGMAVAWGDPSFTSRFPLTGIAKVSSVASFDQAYRVALKTDGQVLDFGALKTLGIQVPASLSDVVDVATGFKHGVAVKRDGSVVAWGDNSFGQCKVPAGLKKVAALAAGNFFNAALRQDGSVVAWGANNYDQIKVPAGLKNVVALAAGSAHTLALKDDGTVVAWGFNGIHQCEVPQGLSGVVAVSAADHRSVAVKSDGTIVQWGDQVLLGSGAQKWFPPTGVVAAVPGYGRLSVLVEAPGDFGTRLLNGEKRRHELILLNPTATDLTGVRAVISGPDAGAFSIIGGAQGTIPRAQRVSLDVIFLAHRLGPASATLTISSNAPDGPMVIPLTGTGVLRTKAVPKTSISSAFTYEPLRIDRQTGLVLQKVTFMNTTGSALPGLKLVLSRVAADVKVYSSSVGKVPGTVEVLYTNTMAQGETVSFDLVFFDPQQRTASTVQPVIVAENLMEAEPRPGPVTGVAVPLLSVRDSAQGPLLEWNAVRGKTYVVEYSDDAGKTWLSAVHRLSGGSRILWVDRGQPETGSKPTSKAARSYRVKRVDA